MQFVKQKCFATFHPPALFTFFATIFLWKIITCTPSSSQAAPDAKPRRAMALSRPLVASSAKSSVGSVSSSVAKARRRRSPPGKVRQVTESRSPSCQVVVLDGGMVCCPCWCSPTWNASPNRSDECVLALWEAQFRNQSIRSLNTFRFGHLSHAKAALEEKMLTNSQVSEKLFILEEECAVLPYVLPTWMIRCPNQQKISPSTVAVQLAVCTSEKVFPLIFTSEPANDVRCSCTILISKHFWGVSTSRVLHHDWTNEPLPWHKGNSAIPANDFKRVDFPEPEGPMMAKSSPGATSPALPSKIFTCLGEIAQHVHIQQIIVCWSILCWFI